MILKKRILISIMVVIGIAGSLTSLIVNLIIAITIFMNGSISFNEPNLIILTTELFIIIISIVSFPMIIISIIKNIIFRENFEKKQIEEIRSW